MKKNTNHDDFVKKLFSDGFLITHPWTLSSTVARFTGDGKSPGIDYHVRRMVPKDLYSSPSDSWRKVWGQVSNQLAVSGEYAEYCRPAQAVEAWMQLKGDRTIEESVEIRDWPVLAKGILKEKPTEGLLAVRGCAADDTWSPGVTVVVETPAGGGAGAFLGLAFLSQNGVGSALARQETQHGANRWGVIKLIYCPSWYVASRDKCLGVDWHRWSQGPIDENETKRVWCESVAMLTYRLRRELGEHLIDSVIFDEYAVRDVAGISNQELTHICHSSPKNLASSLTGEIGAKP